MELTRKELDLILYVFTAHSSRVKLQAAAGKYNQERADRLTKEMCTLSSKIYQEVLAYDRAAT